MLQVARRITLQRLMPDAGKTFSLLFTKLQIQEPCFSDVVILYRKSKQVLDRPNAEKDTLPSYGQVTCCASAYSFPARLHALLASYTTALCILACMKLATTVSDTPADLSALIPAWLVLAVANCSPVLTCIASICIMSHGSIDSSTPWWLQGMLQRNLVVKSFCDIPMADMEMIFPEKRVYIKPFILIQLVVTVVLAVFTILSTLVQVCSSSACHHYLLYLPSFTRLSQLPLACLSSHTICIACKPASCLGVWCLADSHYLCSEQGEPVGVGQPGKRDSGTRVSGVVPLTADTPADARCHDPGAV